MHENKHKINKLFNAQLFLVAPLLMLQCTQKTAQTSMAFPFFSNTDSTDTTDPVLFEAKKLSTPIDSICVLKHKRRMFVYHEKQLVKTYLISLGTNPVGHKQFQGDRKTPEGIYYINGKNPNSMAHKNLGISYPNDNDRKFARNRGKSPGGDVKIHGMVNGWEAGEEEYRLTDWTWGCIAVRNWEVDELYENVAMGSPINILP